MVLKATVVALAGLIANSVAVIIGAMLILLSWGYFFYCIKFCFRKTNKQSIAFGAKLLTSSKALSAVITIGLSMVIPIEITPEIQSRTEKSLLELLLQCC